ncbi:MAG: MFS transporter [Chloroflexi bacterium]|nr:MFS transporter [Chloroflexota bacterium]
MEKRPAQSPLRAAKGSESASEAVAPLVPRQSRWLAPFESLQVSSYRIYWSSMFLSFALFQMQMMARSWFMYDLTHKGVLLGLLNLASAVPMLTLSLFGGALADRIPKRTLLLSTQLGMAVTSLGLAIIIGAGVIEWWHLVLFGLVQGALTAFMMPARQSIIPELVERRLLFNAVSLSSAEMSANRVIAPALAGILIATLGVSMVFFTMAALSAAAFVIMLFLPPTPPAPRAATSMLKDMAEVQGYIWRHKVILSLLTVSFVSVVFGMPLQYLMPIFTEDVLRVGPRELGWILSLMGAGSLVGSLAAAALGDFKKKGLLLVVLTVVMGISTVVFTMTRSVPLALAVIVPVGLGQSGRMTINNTLLQMHTDKHVLGRVMAVNMMQVGLQPLGTVPLGLAADWVGAPWAMGVAGGVVLVFGLYLMAFRRDLRELP